MYCLPVLIAMHHPREPEGHYRRKERPVQGLAVETLGRAY
jgi:hypothetical protein